MNGQKIVVVAVIKFVFRMMILHLIRPEHYLKHISIIYSKMIVDMLLPYIRVYLMEISMNILVQS